MKTLAAFMVFIAISLTSIMGEATWPPDWCFACGDSPTACAEAPGWCRSALCPENLEPLLCPGAPSYEACVFVGLTVCDDTYDTTWCCGKGGADLGPEWFCAEAKDCPTGPDCLEAQCWPFFGVPNPYGTWGKCLYAQVPDGTVCDDNGGTHCAVGVCAP